MEMLMSGEALLLLMVLIVVGGLVYALVRIYGAHAVEGDHPGEKGYDPEDHHPH